MISKAIARLQYLCESIPALLSQLSEQDLSYKSSPAKWSKKEIIGHLIDSATNNHQRFVRGQFEETPRISYDQNSWNQYNYYQQMDSEQLISFWLVYNRQLLALIKLIPSDMLSNLVNTVGENNFTLSFLINDYVAHLEHHLKQVTSGYPEV